jgi:hypothetical protein
VADALSRPDGSRVSVMEVDDCFAEVPGIAHYQLRARTDGGFLLRYVAENSPPPDQQLEMLQARLAEVLGSRQLSLEPTDLLLAETSGKFRMTSADKL